MGAGDVVLSLRDARALLADDKAIGVDAVTRRLERAVRRAERELTPTRWRTSRDYSRRDWPDRDGHCAAFAWGEPERGEGWKVYVNPPPGGWRDPALIASGPETGAEGRRLADRALSRWLKRRGVAWKPTGVPRG